MYWISADFSGWFRVNPTKCLKPFLQNMWLSNFNLGKGGGRLTTNSPLPPPYVRPWLDNGRQNECFKWIWYFALNKFLNSETKGRSITCDFLSSLFLPGVAIIMASSNLKKKKLPTPLHVHTHRVCTLSYDMRSRESGRCTNPYHDQMP